MSEAQEYDPEALVEAMFTGSRAALRPLYEELLKIGIAIGKDVPKPSGPRTSGRTLAALKIAHPELGSTLCNCTMASGWKQLKKVKAAQNHVDAEDFTTRHETPKPLKNMPIDALQGLAMAGVIPPTGIEPVA